MEKLHITVVIGTAREGRQSKGVADMLMSEVGQREGVSATLVDARDFPFTRTEPGWEESEIAKNWRDVVRVTDGFIFVIPEYNRSFPGELKLLLDSESPKHYARRAAMLVGVSSGSFGGARVITSIQPIISELGLVHTNKPLFITKAETLFDESGEIAADRKEALAAPLEGALDELLWFARALKDAKNR